MDEETCGAAEELLTALVDEGTTEMSLLAMNWPWLKVNYVQNCINYVVGVQAKPTFVHMSGPIAEWQNGYLGHFGCSTDW
jgi:hypothetical protein